MAADGPSALSLDSIASLKLRLRYRLNLGHHGHTCAVMDSLAARAAHTVSTTCKRERLFTFTASMRSSRKSQLTKSDGQRVRHFASATSHRPPEVQDPPLAARAVMAQNLAVRQHAETHDK